MIPSSRFGDVILNPIYNDYISCNLHSLYKGGIESVANNREFCLFLLTDIYRKLSLHSHPIQSFDGYITREHAEMLYNNLDATSHLFYKECAALLRRTIRPEDPDDVSIAMNEEKFRMIANKVIKDFSISETGLLEDTFQEYAILEFKVANLNLMNHIAGGLLVEC